MGGDKDFGAWVQEHPLLEIGILRFVHVGPSGGAVLEATHEVNGFCDASAQTAEDLPDDLSRSRACHRCTVCPTQIDHAGATPPRPDEESDHPIEMTDSQR